MSALRVFVVDDEAPARRKLLRFLAGDSDVEVVGEAANGRDAVEGIRRTHPDLLLLDVQMPDFDGFEVVKQLAPPLPRIVFVTAFDEYAIRAFDVHAFGYLLKPFDQPRFRKVLDDAKEQLLARGSGSDENLRRLLAEMEVARRGPTRVAVEDGERIFFVTAGEIDWIESERNYLLIHAGAKTYTIRGTLDAMEERLDRSEFVRINRSAMVRVDAVRELQKWFHGEYKVMLKSGASLRWTRRYLGRQGQILQKL
ncbi:MAG: LytTR family DNA-binding domain-containing protein [Terriglobales bacterium]